MLVTDDSRLARDELVAAIIRDRLRRHGVRLITPSGEVDLNDSAHWFTSGVLALASQLEQGLRRQKMTQGLRAAARAGFWPGGPAPYGYRLAGDSDGSPHKRLEVDDQEAAVLRRATGLIVDDGLSVYAACRALNAEGLHTRSGTRWWYRNLAFQLHKEMLTGRFTYQTSAGPITIDIPRILPRERWETLRARLHDRAVDAPGKQHGYPLTGHLRCTCGGALSGVYRKDHRLRYYKCAKNSPEEQANRCPCYPRLRPADQIEQQVWEQVYAILSDPDYLDGLAREHLATQAPTEEAEQQLQTLYRRLEELSAQEVRIIRDLSLDPDLIHRALARIRDDRKQVKEQIGRLQTWQKRRITLDQQRQALTRLAHTARTRLAHPSPELMRRVFALVDLQARELPDGGLEVRGTIPLPTDGEEPPQTAVGGMGRGELRSEALQHP